MTRTIIKDRPLYDGTPRCEKGYRVVVEDQMGPDRHGKFPHQYWWSPLFKTMRQAERWDLTMHRLRLNGLMT